MKKKVNNFQDEIPEIFNSSDSSLDIELKPKRRNNGMFQSARPQVQANFFQNLRRQKTIDSEIIKNQLEFKTFEYKLSKNLKNTEEYLTEGILKGKRVRHAIDPHKDIGLESAPIQNKSFYFNKPSSKVE